MKKCYFLLLVFALLKFTSAFSQIQKTSKHENVVYANISGLSLLMDVYQPLQSNHLGIIYIAGNAWGYFEGKTYNQGALKDALADTAYAGKWPMALVKKGYTVFMINHRFAPLYHFPEIFYDCQRAVRYVRHKAKKYGIDPNHIGAMGHSSGANLSSMLGVTDTVINKPDNAIDSVSSKVQAVVTLAAPFILSDINKKEDTALVRDMSLRIHLNYIGELPEENNNEFVLSGKYAQASPITYINRDDAATLIYYSDNDFIIPGRQQTATYQKLKEAGVPTKIILKHNELHFPKPDIDEVDKWFRQYLK